MIDRKTVYGGSREKRVAQENEEEKGKCWKKGREATQWPASRGGECSLRALAEDAAAPSPTLSALRLHCSLSYSLSSLHSYLYLLSLFLSLLPASLIFFLSLLFSTLRFTPIFALPVSLSRLSQLRRETRRSRGAVILSRSGRKALDGESWRSFS